MRLTALILILLLVASCGNSTARPHGTVFVQQQLAELERLPAPAGVTPATWQQLKSALAVMLQENASKQALAAPSSAASASVLALDDASLELSWDYASQGDYDQNLETNIADLSPLATHFGENT